MGNIPALKLTKEIPRSRRFETSEDEDRLLAAADPYMHAFTVALIDTASRPAKIRTLQWKNVNLQRRTWVIEASKEKTRTERSGMVSTRLGHLLEMRQLDPAGEPWPGEAYIFGDELGRLLSLATIRDRWTVLVGRVGLEGLQLRDMRHEGANQYEETGTTVSDVSQLLGHTNIATTSRYLRNKRRRMAQLAVDRLDHAGPRPRRRGRWPRSSRRRGRQSGRADAIALTLNCRPVAAPQGRNPRMTEDQTTHTLVREAEQLFGEEAWQHANDCAYDRARVALEKGSDEWLRVFTAAFHAELRRLLTPH